MLLVKRNIKKRNPKKSWSNNDHRSKTYVLETQFSKAHVRSTTAHYQNDSLLTKEIGSGMDKVHTGRENQSEMAKEQLFWELLEDWKVSHVC